MSEEDKVPGLLSDKSESDHDDDQECSDDDEGIDENPISDEQDEDQNDLVGRKMSSDEAHSKAVELKLTGNKFYGEGKYDEAVQKYKEGLAHNQADKQDKQRQTKLFIILKNNLALIYIKQGKFEEARDCCYDADDADSKLERTFIRCHQAFLGLDEQVLAYHSLCRGHNRVQSEAKKELMEAIDKMKKDYPSATVTQPTKNLTLRQIASEYFSKTNIPKVLKPGLSENKGKKTAGVSGDGLDPKPSAVCNDDGSESSDDGTEGSDSHQETKSSKTKVGKKVKKRPDEETRRARKEEAQRKREQEEKERKEKREQEEKERKEKREQEEKERKVKREQELELEGIRKEKERLKTKEERLKREQEGLRREKEEMMRDEEKSKNNEEFKARVKMQKEFSHYLEEGSLALQNEAGASSFEFMHKALQLIKTQYDSLCWIRSVKEVSNPEVVAIRYIYGRAGVETNIYENIILARDSFNHILTHHQHVKFPAVYFGFALLYQKLNRYDESKKYTKQGLAYLEKGLVFPAINWPGLPTLPINETIKENLFKMLTSLRLELNLPPEPNAICRFKECLTNQVHILPSDKIYLSDPDYKGHYRLQCNEECRLEYHKLCWNSIKENIKVGKIRTEKDCLGQPCLTPDCGGTFVKIIFFDQNGMEHVKEDTNIRRVDDEEKRRKRDEEAKNKIKNESKKKKKRRKSPTFEDNDISVKENVPIAEPDYSSNQIDYSNIDVSNATVVKKTKAPEMDEEEGQKKKKEKKKNVLSLDEFRGSSGVERNPGTWPGNINDQPDDFNSRVDRANQFKAFVENNFEPSAEVSTDNCLIKPVINGDTWTRSNPYSSPPTWSNQNQTNQIYNGYSNYTSNSLNESDFDQAEPEVIKESVWSFLEDLLRKEEGPLHHQDPKIWTHIDASTLSIIGGPDNILNFVMVDPKARFRYFQDYICLISDLSKTISLCTKRTAPEPYLPSYSLNPLLAPSPPEPVNPHHFTHSSSSSGAAHNSLLPPSPITVHTTLSPVTVPNPLLSVSPAPVSNTDSGAHEIRRAVEEARAKENALFEENDKSYNSEITEKTNHGIDNLLKGMREKLRQQPESKETMGSAYYINRGSAYTLAAGVQTDISSLDLDDEMDLFTLQQTNTELVEELQNCKDKIAKIQNDKKIELKELTETSKSQQDELTRAKLEIQKFRDENFKLRKIALDVQEKERELKGSLGEMKVNLEAEQRLSYDWMKNGEKLKEENRKLKNDVTTQKEFIIEVQFSFYIKLIDAKRELNDKTLMFLTELKHNPSYALHSLIIDQAIKDFEDYKKTLVKATEEVTTLARTIQSHPFPHLDYDIKKIEIPKLASKLFLLVLDVTGATPAELTFNSVPPFALPNLGIRGPPPPMGSLPPGYGVPAGFRSAIRPPGLPERDSSQNRSGSETSGSSASGPIHKSGATRFSMGEKRDVLSPTTSKSGFSGFSDVGATRHMIHPTAVAPGFLPAAAATSRASAASPSSSGDVGKNMKKNHEKLIEKLREKFSLSPAEANRQLQLLREQNGGKLSGLSVHDIFQTVRTNLEHETETKDCAICMEEMVNISSSHIRVLEPCKHMFHSVCIKKWLDTGKSGNLCPMCRNYVAKDDEYPALNARPRGQK